MLILNIFLMCDQQLIFLVIKRHSPLSSYPGSYYNIKGTSSEFGLDHTIKSLSFMEHITFFPFPELEDH